MKRISVWVNKEAGLDNMTITALKKYIYSQGLIMDPFSRSFARVDLDIHSFCKRFSLRLLKQAVM